MNKIRKMKKANKIIFVSLSSVVILAALICLTAYLIMHRYISKVNYVPLEEADGYAAASLYEDIEAEYYGEGSEADGQAGARYSNVAEAESTLTGAGQTDTADGISEEAIESFNQLTDYELDANIRKNILNQTKSAGEGSKVLNILLIGTDNRIAGNRGLSDSMIVISINEGSKKIIATSLLRDIYLHIPGKEKNNRLNTAYASGGAKLLIQTIEENFKLKIDKYVTIDFYSFIDIVDEIGGVELEITKEELPIVNDYIMEINRLQKEKENLDCLTKPGVQHLNGKQALGYSRVRYVGTDFGRTARQRKVLELVYQKVKKLSIGKITDLLDIILPQVTTNFTEKEMISQILSLPNYLDYGLDSWSVPVPGSYENVKIRGMQVLGIDFEKNIEELNRRIYLTN